MLSRFRWYPGPPSVYVHCVQNWTLGKGFTSTLGELGASFGLGFYVLGNLLRLPLSLKTRGWIKIVLILSLGYAIYFLAHVVETHSEQWVGHAIRMEPLLICILASFYITNFSQYRAEFLKRLHDVEILVYVAFFTMTGASLNISVLDDVIGIATILFGSRMLTMIIGSYTGGILAKDPPLHLHLGWMPYITQAGVALGLTTVVANNFPAWGPTFSTSIIALVVINQLIGPPLFKWACVSVSSNLEAPGVHNVRSMPNSATKPVGSGGDERVIRPSLRQL